MKRIITFYLTILFGIVISYADKTKSSPDTPIVQDTLINKLLEMHITTNARESGINGYRVHIYTDSGTRSKLRTDQAKVEFDEEYPGIRSYVTYDEPNYRIRVGDFRTRLEATRFLNSIQRKYPAAYIVPEKINFPELDVFSTTDDE